MKSIHIPSFCHYRLSRQDVIALSAYVHDDAMAWKPVPHCSPFVRESTGHWCIGQHWKGRQRGSSAFSLLFARTVWINSRFACDLRHLHLHMKVKMSQITGKSTVYSNIYWYPCNGPAIIYSYILYDIVVSNVIYLSPITYSLKYFCFLMTLVDETRTSVIH